MTQAQKWQQQFVVGVNKDRVKDQLALSLPPYATRFNNESQTEGRTVDSNVILDEFHMFTDGSIINSRTGRIVEVSSPTSYETMTPSQRAQAFKEIEAGTRRNLGTILHPIFAEDIKDSVDREALSNSHFWPALAAAAGQ